MARNDRPNRQPLFDTQKSTEKPKEPEVLAGPPVEPPKPSENSAQMEATKVLEAQCSLLQGQVEAKDKLLSALDEELKLHKSILEEMQKDRDAALEKRNAAVRMAESALAGKDKEIAELEAELDKLTTPSMLPESGWSSPRARELVQAVSVVDQPYLLGDMLAMLAPHAGETGSNETATDTLGRVLVERGRNLSREESLVKECKQERSRADAAEQRVATLQAALVARRAPDATSGTVLADVERALTPVLSTHWPSGTRPLASEAVSRVVEEWKGLRAFFSDKPLVALAVKDESTSAVADRFSLLLLEWDGKRLSPTALETVRPWGDIHPRLQHMLNTRLVPKPFR